ncbi:hypothetical protein [Candidatus Synchoanobacter obligatus]|uniref:Uncharacterized protein n=1 Tax=Candidatus Synchoanobacter obligatus TaxID=2919597 RepID=A0ABT1L636_9GAMM|nr:hypothetical protein [Candidatus Synchoanobacter obligatus]MCP8352401.1 hypothetical protein [Candidatus Synchoanobacter obligatus]
MNINEKTNEIIRRVPADISDSSIDAIHQSLHKLYDDAKLVDISDEDLAFLQTAFGCQSEDETKKTLALYRVYEERTQIQEDLITSLDDCYNTWLSSGDMDKDTIVNFIFDAIMEQPRFQYILASSPEVARNSIDPVALKSRLNKLFNNRIEDESIHFKMKSAVLTSAEKTRLDQIMQRKRELGFPNSTYDIGFRMSLDLNPLRPPTPDMSLQEVLFPHRHAFRRLGSDVKDSRVVKQYKLSGSTAFNYTAILESSDISYETIIGFLSAISPTLIRHASNKDQARETIAAFNKYMRDPASGYPIRMTELLVGSLLNGVTVVTLHLTKKESMLLNGLPGITALTTAAKALPITEHGREVDEKKWLELENNKALIESGRVYFSPEGQLQSWDSSTNAFKDMDTEKSKFKHKSKEAGLIITTDQEMYCFDHLYGGKNSRGLIAYHSMISSGRPVMYAGSIKVTNGKIKYISDLSGHFKPRSSSLIHLAVYLANHNVLTTDILTKSRQGFDNKKLVSLFKNPSQAHLALGDLLAAPDLTDTGKQCIAKIVRNSIKFYDKNMNRRIRRLLQEPLWSNLRMEFALNISKKDFIWSVAIRYWAMIVSFGFGATAAIFLLPPAFLFNVFFQMATSILALVGIVSYVKRAYETQGFHEFVVGFLIGLDAALWIVVGEVFALGAVFFAGITMVAVVLALATYVAFDSLSPNSANPVAASDIKPPAKPAAGPSNGNRAATVTISLANGW